MEEYKVFETERLMLKPTQINDADFVYELMNMPKWKQNIGDRNIKTSADAESYIKTRMIPQLIEKGYSNYTVIRKMDQVKIGSCGLYDREGIDGVDIGFAFLPQFEKKGYAYESAMALVNAANEIFKLSIISAITLKTNSSSKALLQKIGLKEVGPIKLKGDPEELILFRIEF